MKCPDCGSRMVNCRDDVCRYWVLCAVCGVQIPVNEGRVIISNDLRLIPSELNTIPCEWNPYEDMQST